MLCCTESQATTFSKITYVITIYGAEELSKASAKRVAIPALMELSKKEPWDTFKAQLLVRIDNALHPGSLDINNYNVMFYIPRILPKPGLVLQNQDNYTSLLMRAANLTSKTPTISLVVKQKKPTNNQNQEVDKENQGVPVAAPAGNPGDALTHNTVTDYTH